MPRPSSLAFRILDGRVVDGQALDIVVRDDRRALSVADLLHESASVAGGLQALGVTAGTAMIIDLDAPSVEVVCVLLAAVRLQAEPVPPESADSTPSTLVVERDVTIRHDGHDIDYRALRALGRNDPAPAAKDDPAGYEARQVSRWPAILGELAAGRDLVLASPS